MSAKTTTKKDHRIEIRGTRQLKSKLEKAADKFGMSRNALAAIALDKGIDQVQVSLS